MASDDLTPQLRLALLSPKQRQALEIWCHPRDPDLVAVRHEIAATLRVSYQRAGQFIDSIKKKLGENPLEYSSVLTEPATAVPPGIADAFADDDDDDEEDVPVIGLGRPEYADPGDPPKLGDSHSGNTSPRFS